MLKTKEDVGLAGHSRQQVQSRVLILSNLENCLISLSSNWLTVTLNQMDAMEECKNMEWNILKNTPKSYKLTILTKESTENATIIHHRDRSKLNRFIMFNKNQSSSLRLLFSEDQPLSQ